MLAIAHREQRTLITEDTNFGELVFRPGQVHAGVILLRLPPFELVDKTARLSKLLAEHAHELDLFIVVDQRRVP